MNKDRTIKTKEQALRFALKYNRKVLWCDDRGGWQPRPIAPTRLIGQQKRKTSSIQD